MKSEPFKITLIDKYGLTIPKNQLNFFIENNLKRVKIKATKLDKDITFYAALKRQNTGDYRIYFSNEKQKTLNLNVGETVTLQIFEDTSKYGVEMPEALDAVLLSDYDAFSIFETLTLGKQRSIIYTIKRIKNVQNQVDKSILMTENLKRGIKDLKMLFKN